MMEKPMMILPQLLADLDKQALIGIIIRQGNDLAQSWQENQTLRQERDALLKRLEELERAGKRPTAPFRIEEEKRKKDKKQAGSPKGHRGYYRQVSGPLSEQIQVELSCCPTCQGAVKVGRALKQVVEELVIGPHRVELTTYEGECEQCGKVYSRHPFQTSAAVGSAGCHLGIQAAATAVLLNHRYGMSKRKVCALFKDWGLPLSIGGLVQLQHRLADQLQDDYQALIQQAKTSAVLYSDETSWYVAAPKGWLWSFTNADFTLYHVEESRSREVVEKVIGKDYVGVLVSDCLSVYDGVSPHQQKCYAHHLKAIKQALELLPQSEYLLNWQQLLKKAIEWKKQLGLLKNDDYDSGCVELALQAVQLLKKPPAHPIEEKIHNRLSKQADHLFTFLRIPEVEATNNRAERSLRPAVITRKISCGNKTRKGADTWQVLASLNATALQKGADFNQAIADAIKQRLPR